jgi:ketosteroid isomerase-like protein
MTSTADDLDAIRRLLAEYCHAIDGGDSEGWAGLFTEDGVFDLGGSALVGREALAKFAASVPPGGRHVVVNELIDIDGDEASVRAYLFLFAGSPAAVATRGTYDDKLQRGPDGWRFARRAFTPD